MVSIIQGAATIYEGHLVCSQKMGGIQKKKHLSMISKEWADYSNKAPMSGDVHPALAALG